MKIAVLIPCHNEERAIGHVVQDFNEALPGAAIYVYDNASIDRTAQVAAKAGAIVRHEPLKGKGNVVRRMFADIEADIYVLVDGDATYDVAKAPGMIDRLVLENLDMVVGRRRSDGSAAYRLGHQFGNRLLTGAVRAIFGRRLLDMMSGFRVFSRRFVKSFTAVSSGFEIETEMTVHALALRLPVAEVDTVYIARMDGSESKLRTVRDGVRILITILNLFREERPLAFCTVGFAILCVLSLILAEPVVSTYVTTHTVPRLPTALLATGIMLLAFISLASGFILDAMVRTRREAQRLIYLAQKAPAEVIERQSDRVVKRDALV